MGRLRCSFLISGVGAQGFAPFQGMRCGVFCGSLRLVTGGGCRQGVRVCCRLGGFVILGVTSPKPPAEGRLRPPDPLQKGVWVW
jgi:hypothetical protein